MKVDESWRELQLSPAFDRQLSCILINSRRLSTGSNSDESQGSLCAFDQSCELMRVTKLWAVCTL